MPEQNNPQVSKETEKVLEQEASRNKRIEKLNTKKLLTWALMILMPVVILILTWIPFFFDFLNIIG